MKDVDLSVVIPSWNTRALLARCLDTLAAADPPGEVEVIVVDNASTDDSVRLVRERFSEVVLIANARNEGFARACNQGILQARGRYVLLLNTDTEMPPEGLTRMVSFLEGNPEYGAVAPRLVDAAGRTQRTVMAFPSLWTPLFFATPLERWLPHSRELRRYFLRDWDQESSRDIDQPPAACLLLRRAVLDQVGLFDERLWLFYNDVDLSLRMRQAGWRTRYLADVAVLHHVGASTSKFGRFVPEWQRNRLSYYRKNHGRLAALWVKLCVGLTLADFAVTQWWSALRGRPRERVGPMAREYLAFLLR